MFDLIKSDRFKPHPDDFIIIIMGPTGSGKTNLINNFTGNAERRRAANLASDTQKVIPYPVQYHELRLVLVDTPGFDDTYRSDGEILRMIADWLIQKYPDGTTLKSAGILYLHRITDNRMAGSARKNLEMFGRLCGDIAFGRTLLVTTMWDLVKDSDVATRRQEQLKSDFWQPLLELGAKTKQFHNTPESAEDIIRDVLTSGKDREELLLQEELVEQQKRLNETEAGKVLYNRLQKLLAEQRGTLKSLAEEAKLQNDSDLAKSLLDEYNKIDALLQKTFEEIKEMKIPLSRRLRLWLFTRKSRARAIALGYQ